MAHECATHMHTMHASTRCMRYLHAHPHVVNRHGVTAHVTCHSSCCGATQCCSALPRDATLCHPSTLASCQVSLCRTTACKLFGLFGNPPDSDYLSATPEFPQRAPSEVRAECSISSAPRHRVGAITGGEAGRLPAPAACLRRPPACAGRLPAWPPGLSGSPGHFAPWLPLRTRGRRAPWVVTPHTTQLL